VKYKIENAKPTTRNCNEKRKKELKII